MRIIDPNTNEVCPNPSDEPNAQKQHWEKGWKKRDTHISANFRRHIRKYIEVKGQIDFSEDDFKPTYHLVEETILATNDSAAGPDGIPFIAYRACCGTATKIFQSCVQELLKTNGHRPSHVGEFNRALLHLLPKKPTRIVNEAHNHLPKDMRPLPLSVSCCYNRIIASCVKKVIAPKVYRWISPEQKGAIPG